MLIDDFSVVYLHVSGEWIRKETAGHEPKPTYKSGAVVIDDKMLVLGRVGDTFSGRNVIYSLDLNNWTWSLLTPNGNPPTEEMAGISLWAHAGKMYGFGGAGQLLQPGERRGLFCYNLSDNSWEWPDQGGDVPSPRTGSLTIVKDDSVYLFGGRRAGTLVPGAGPYRAGPGGRFNRKKLA